MLPSSPKTSDTAGLTRNIVEVPVIPKTTQSKAISAYHLGVFLGGMALGARNRLRKEVGAPSLPPPLLLLLLLLLFALESPAPRPNHRRRGLRQALLPTRPTRPP